MRSLFSHLCRPRGMLLGAVLMFVWFAWPIVPIGAQVCATGGNCKASCDVTETEAIAGKSFCTVPPRNICCVPTSMVCLSPKTCQAEANCDSATIDRTKTCGTEVCCVRRTSTPPGGLPPGGPVPPGGGIPPGGGPPAPNFQTITFSNVLNFDTVDAFLGKILGWLQGVVATLALVFIVIGGFLYVTSAGDSSRIETAKKCIGAAVIGLALVLAAPSFLREIAGILGWGSVGTLPGTQLSLLQILTNTMNFLLSVVGVFAIIMLVVGGIMYLTAAGDEDQIDRAKKIVLSSIIGIAVALAALVLVSQLANFFK